MTRFLDLSQYARKVDGQRDASHIATEASSNVAKYAEWMSQLRVEQPQIDRSVIGGWCRPQDSLNLEFDDICSGKLCDLAEEAEFDVLTAQEVAQLLRVNIKTVYENAKAGSIPCIQLGRHFRFSREAIMARLEECKSASRRKEH